MQTYELYVESAEQQLALSDTYTADIKFDMIYKRWYYDLYNEGVMVAAGIALVPDSAGLLHISPVSIGLIDVGNANEDYEPYYALGNRLAVIEIQE